jgi:hypothetical protein
MTDHPAQPQCRHQSSAKCCGRARAARNRRRDDLSVDFNSLDWRPRPELNWCKRFCRPLRNHSATWPHRAGSIQAIKGLGNLPGIRRTKVLKLRIRCISETGVSKRATSPFRTGPKLHSYTASMKRPTSCVITSLPVARRLPERSLIDGRSASSQPLRQGTAPHFPPYGLALVKTALPVGRAVDPA